MNEYYKIMTKDLAKHLIDHRHFGLAPQTVSKFPLHHPERGFNVGPLEIVLQKLLSPKLEVVMLRIRS
jgi:hypothetical protein